MVICISETRKHQRVSDTRLFIQAAGTSLSAISVERAEAGDVLQKIMNRPVAEEKGGMTYVNA